MALLLAVVQRLIAKAIKTELLFLPTRWAFEDMIKAYWPYDRVEKVDQQCWS